MHVLVAVIVSVAEGLLLEVIAGVVLVEAVHIEAIRLAEVTLLVEVVQVVAIVITSHLI